jgi:hypothetical protein
MGGSPFRDVSKPMRGGLLREAENQGENTSKR